MEENPILLALIILIGFPIAFSLLWSFVLLINSFMTGWHILAREYGFSREFRGKLFRFQSVTFRFGQQYTGVMNIGANEEGIYIVPILIFRPFHTPVFIPWYDIETEPVSYIIVKLTRLKLQKLPRLKLSIRDSLYNQLAEYKSGEASYFPD